MKQTQDHIKDNSFSEDLIYMKEQPKMLLILSGNSVRLQKSFGYDFVVWKYFPMIVVIIYLNVKIILLFHSYIIHLCLVIPFVSQFLSNENFHSI